MRVGAGEEAAAIGRSRDIRQLQRRDRVQLEIAADKALVASLVWADLMASVTETPESSTETDLDVAVLVE